MIYKLAAEVVKMDLSNEEISQQHTAYVLDAWLGNKNPDEEK